MKKPKPHPHMDATEIGRIICAGIAADGPLIWRVDGPTLVIVDEDSVYTFTATECRDLGRAFHGAALILEAGE